MRVFEHPRLVAASWFGGCGAIASALLLIAQSPRKLPAENLFAGIVLPSASAGLAGAIQGHAILDQQKTKTALMALLRGIALTFLSFAILTPALVVVYVVTNQDGVPRLSTLMAMVVAASLGALVVAMPWMVCAGGVAAIALFAFQKRQRRVG